MHPWELKEENCISSAGKAGLSIITYHRHPARMALLVNYSVRNSEMPPNQLPLSSQVTSAWQMLNKNSTLLTHSSDGPGTPGALSCKAVPVGMTNPQPTPNLCRICCSRWMHASLHGLMGSIPQYSKSCLVSLQDLSQLLFNSLGHLKRFQSSGSCQTLPQFSRRKTVVIAGLPQFSA